MPPENNNTGGNTNGTSVHLGTGEWFAIEGESLVDELEPMPEPENILDPETASEMLQRLTEETIRIERQSERVSRPRTANPFRIRVPRVDEGLPKKSKKIKTGQDFEKELKSSYE